VKSTAAIRPCKLLKTKSRIAIASANQQREKQRCDRCCKSSKAATLQRRLQAISSQKQTVIAISALQTPIKAMRRQ